MNAVGMVRRCVRRQSLDEALVEHYPCWRILDTDYRLAIQPHARFPRLRLPWLKLLEEQMPEGGRR